MRRETASKPGPMVRDAGTSKYRRVRLFLLTLAHSRKAVRRLTEKSSTKICAQLHEQAFRRLGGATATVVLDNLREGRAQAGFQTITSGRC